MNKPKVSRAVAALEGRRLVRRATNKEDMREAFLALTPAGRGMYEQIVPLARDYVTELTRLIGPEDLTRFEAGLDRLVALRVTAS